MSKLDRLFKIDFYPHDWLLDTGSMENDERGVFIQIVMLMYAKRGPIDNDPSWIGRASNLTPTKAKNLINRLILAGFLTENEGKLNQKRTQNEIELKSNHLENSSKGGKLSGGQNRKDNDLEASGTEKQKQPPSPSPSPSPNKEDIPKGTSSKRAPDKKSSGYTDNFEAFFVVYPKNNGPKKTAYESYNRAIKEGIDHEIIIAGAGRYAAFTISEGTEQRYIAHAATWLNQRRWESDYSVAINGSRKAAPGTDSYSEGKAGAARRAVQQGLSEVGHLFTGQRRTNGANGGGNGADLFRVSEDLQQNAGTISADYQNISNDIG